MARKNTSDEFFNQARPSDALRKLFPDPGNRGENFWKAIRADGSIKSARRKVAKGERNKFLDALADVHDKCHLIWDDPANNTGVKRIGYWGQCLALGVLWSLVQSDTPYANITVARLADEVINHGKEKGWVGDEHPDHPLEYNGLIDDWGVDIKKKQEQLCHTYVGTLTLFLKTRQEMQNIPCVDVAAAVHRSLASFVFIHLSQSAMLKLNEGVTEDALCEHLETTDYTSPDACFEGLVGFLGLTDVVSQLENVETPQTGKSWVEPSIWRYVTSRTSEKTKISDPDIQQAVANIDTSLGLPSDPNATDRRILAVTGNAHSGKKAIIGDFIKKIHDRSGSADLQFGVQGADGGDGQQLPVLCLSVKDRDALTICIEVLVFLQRLAQSRPLPQDEACQRTWAVLDRSGSAQRLTELLTRIHAASKLQPALFIFLDVQPIDNTDTRNLLNRMRMDNLINALKDGNADSRFLVTAQDAAKVMGATGCTPVEMERPTFKRLAWYLNDAEEKAFAADPELQRFKDRKVDGNILMVMSVLFSEPALPQDAFRDLVKACFDQPQPPKAEVLDALCQKLISIWSDQGVLPFLALILASDDGMMDSTLTESIQAWRACQADLKALTTEEGLKQIKTLNLRCRGLFLRRMPAMAFIKEELRFSEADPHDTAGDYQTWNFDNGLITNFRRLMSEDEASAETMRCAYRLVASAARSRARYQQLKGFTIRREFGPRFPERSIQAFVSLMLSLNKDAIYTNSKESFAGSVPLPLSTRKVFALNEAGFDQAAALRYAYHVLIGEEADPKHKLSMTLDADVLRLQLFALLCANPGESFKYRDDGWFNENRWNLPEELVDASLEHFKVFPLKEQADILVSLGMAAFYCNHRPILMWAEAKLFQIRTADEPLTEQLSRLVAARVDLECQIGRPMKKSGPAKRNKDAFKYGKLHPKKALKYVHGNLQRDIEAICPNISKSEDIGTDLQTFAFAEVAAWLRLNSRLLLVEGLTHRAASAKTAARCEQLIALENKFLAEKRSPRSIAQHGRTGRLQIKLLSSFYPLLDHPAGADAAANQLPEDFKIRLRTMVHANVSRLSQFSGAERALTLCDHARYLMLDGQLVAADRAVNEARRVAFQGLSSDGTRLDVLMLECAIQLAQAESDAYDTDHRIDRLSSVRDSLELIKRMMVANQLAFEELFLEVLAWRAVLVAQTLGVAFRPWSDVDQLTLAIERAHLHQADGLAAQLVAMKQ